MKIVNGPAELRQCAEKDAKPDVRTERNRLLGRLCNPHRADEEKKQPKKGRTKRTND
jgi:hypothetical protein